ncbi:hypothetical protein NQL38_004128 [Providencia rettgeri]|nr:hypothetical protein [Providencia rettgeri]ELR5166446.1 hypothetical protein [Providencia rettgeri]HEC8349210.1 hypothetical protein [Providencia rettgeri]
MRDFLIACCVAGLVICGGNLKVERFKTSTFEVQGIELSVPGVMSPM